MRMHWLLAAALLGAAQIVPAVTDEERTQVYREFRALFDARRYQEALPVAERLVALTEEQYGPDARALVNPLSNLGTTHYRLGNHQAAEESYLRCLKILEATASAADRQFLRPLHGLGATYFAAGQYEDASLVLKRAVDLSRNLNGLFNIGQLEMLEPLIESYVKLGQFEDANKEHSYAFRVAETAYGKQDLRMLGPLDRYAQWFEFTGRYTAARALYARALSIAERSAGRGSVLSVDPLRGIARTYRLEFLHGSVEPAETDFPTGGLLAAQEGGQLRLSPDGERALQLALEALAQHDPNNHAKRGETLVELGDWYMSGGATSKALGVYRQAWEALELAGSTSLLSAPRQLYYKPPASSVKRTTLDPEEAKEHTVDVQFTVTRDGRTADIVAVGGDAPEALQKSVISAVRKARYSPRLENGEPVDTRGVTLSERVVTRRPAERA